MKELVLLVEDNPVNLRLMQAWLGEEDDLEILVATNGAEALHIAFNRLPDVILMDWGLPLLSGLDATRILKATPRTRDIPIVAVTAHAMAGDEARCLEAGCDAYETKPIDARRLIAKLRSLLEKRAIDAVEYLHVQRGEYVPPVDPVAEAEQRRLREEILRVESALADTRQRLAQSATDNSVQIESFDRERMAFQALYEEVDRASGERLAALMGTVRDAEGLARDALSRRDTAERALEIEKANAESWAHERELAVGARERAIGGARELEQRLAQSEIALAAARQSVSAEAFARARAEEALAASQRELEGARAEDGDRLERAQASQKALRTKKVIELEREVERLGAERARMASQLADVRGREEAVPYDARMLQHEIHTQRERLHRLQRTLSTVQNQLRQVLDTSYQSLLYGTDDSDGVSGLTPALLLASNSERPMAKAR